MVMKSRLSFCKETTCNIAQNHEYKSVVPPKGEHMKHET
jgi:hypothetical protein